MSSPVVRHGVWLYDTLAGHIFAHDNYSWFEFAEGYLADPARPVLGLRFEEQLTARVASNMRLPAWFSNLLPEGILRKFIAADAHVSQDRERELLSRVGHDLPGAVRVLPDGTVPAGDLSMPEDSVNPPLPQAEPQQFRMSLAGVGLKFSMLRDGDRFVCPASGVGGDWIVKLPDPVFPGVPRNEFAMMNLAAAAGLDVPETRLMHRDQLKGIPDNVWPGTEDMAFAVRRFDRDVLRGLVHIEDLAQVRGFYPDQKYEGNFETVAGLLYRGHDLPALREFTRRLAFFVLIGNGDAHLKNWSLIYQDRRVPTLSPVYDVVSTEPYAPNGEPENIGLRFAGSRRFSQVRAWQFDRLAGVLGAPERLGEVVADTVRLARAAAPQWLDELRNRVVRDAVASSLEVRGAQLLEGTADG